MINKQESKPESKDFLTFDDAFAKIETEMKMALSLQPPLVKQFTEYLSLSRGKNIRAKALLTCAMNSEKKIHPNAVKFAAAVEILHLATLVHDDVIDDADVRRGMLTLQKKFGKKTAVICGDYLFCIALATAASVENINDYVHLKLPNYIKRICMGELNQHLNHYNFNLSVGKYLRIISGKTAALFQASFNAGIILCEEDSNTVSQYLRLGRYIGMIFQLMDDCADFEEDQDSEKKPVQSDYEQGVITLPLVIALRNSSLKKRAEKNDITPGEINAAVKEAGGLDYTKLLVRRYYEKSTDIIDNLDSPDFKKKKLRWILNIACRIG